MMSNNVQKSTQNYYSEMDYLSTFVGLYKNDPSIVFCLTSDHVGRHACMGRCECHGTLGLVSSTPFLPLFIVPHLFFVQANLAALLECANVTGLQISGVDCLEIRPCGESITVQDEIVVQTSECHSVRIID